VGIDELIDRKAEDAGERALRLTNGSGVDRIVEVALGANLDADLKALAPGGTIAAYASDGDPGLPLPFRQLLWKNATVHFVLVYLVWPGGHRKAGADLTRHLSAGQLGHSISRRLPLSRIIEAHEAMEAGHLNGKLILDIP